MNDCNNYDCLTCVNDGNGGISFFICGGGGNAQARPGDRREPARLYAAPVSALQPRGRFAETEFAVRPL